jgi:GNAT superfamily N-acetyltransferase
LTLARLPVSNDHALAGSDVMAATSEKIVVRSLQSEDLIEAERICRLAFATLRNVAEPETFWNDREYLWARWNENPSLAFTADFEGRLAGTNLGVCWGSVGFFGPLTIRPELWDKGIGRHLIGPVVERLEAQGVRHVGLFTFAESTKHVGLYQKFGFWPRFLTAVMSAPVAPTPEGAAKPSLYSEIPPAEHSRCLAACAALTNALHDGLDLQSTIRAVHAQGAGDTVLVWDDVGLAGFAVCRYGPKSEAGSGNGLIKFGAVRSGPDSAVSFDALLAACHSLAAKAGLSRIIACVNTSRHQAYRHLLARGFRSDSQGVTMHRPNVAGYDRDDVYLLDDWR